MREEAAQCSRLAGRHVLRWTYSHEYRLTIAAAAAATAAQHIGYSWTSAKIDQMVNLVPLR